MLMFLSNRHGAQGTLDGASKSTLENEFGTSKEDDVIVQILEKGTVQEVEVCSPSIAPLPFPSSPSLPLFHCLPSIHWKHN